MRVALGSDHAGFELKNKILAYLKKKHEVMDYGTHGSDSVDYPDYALRACEAVVSGAADFGVLVCGTGVGMSVAANKIKGIRAALCASPETARQAREHVDANVLVLASSAKDAEKIIDVFLGTPFSRAERHVRRLVKLAELEAPSKLSSLKAREVLDSRGNPTVEAEAWAGQWRTLAAAPSGASTGAHEALELRDGGKRYFGKGVTKAVRNVNTIISPALHGKNADARAFDSVILSVDGTPNKQRIGANATIASSMALWRLQSLIEGKALYSLLGGSRSMPCPAANLINGGMHAGNDLDFQEYLVLPVGAKSFAEAAEIVSETYHALKALLEKKYGKSAINVGDEGGFAPPLKDAELPLELILKAASEAGHSKKIKLGLDCAATRLLKGKMYAVNGKKYTPDALVDYYSALAKKFPLAYLEDPFAEDAFEEFAAVSKALGSRVSIVGDDLLCTNPERIKTAIVSGACNALLLKPNQIGTVSEALEAARLAKEAGWKVVVSHRSGETDDSFISDLAVGIGAEYAKIGAPARGERTSKYNRLLRIEEQLRG
ncbi:Enolase [Candidatus Norongarragalina meridionalis]|nr:Enolase [Candidatus Norongarragalina meridionalis]